MELIYGTGNPAKLNFMRREITGLPIELIGLGQAAERDGIALADVEESGRDPLENARIKARAYYRLFRKPVFSCDSGLYLWDYQTGEMLPEEVQPGIHVRGRGPRRLTDDELIAHFTGLVRTYGTILARYKNAICLIMEEGRRYESMDESLWGDAFLFTDRPHPKRIEGFPLDSISLDIASGKYFYDLEDNAQDRMAAETGIAEFFKSVLNPEDFCDK